MEWGARGSWAYPAFPLSQAKVLTLKSPRSESPRSTEGGSIPLLKCIYVLAHLWGASKITDVKKNQILFSFRESRKRKEIKREEQPFQPNSMCV